MRLTPNDIWNPARKSQYNYVANHDGGSSRKPFYAQVGVGDTHGKGVGQPRWRGPRRATALEAAQDYCDYINGLTDLVALPSVRHAKPIIDMGGVIAHAPKVATMPTDRKAYEGPHDLYDVVIYDADDGYILRRKVGVTARGHERYDRFLTMWGFSMGPVCSAVTYPSRQDAERAERMKIAQLSDNPEWTKVGEEAFKPIRQMRKDECGKQEGQGVLVPEKTT